MVEITASQGRVLRFLAAHPQWYPLREIDQIRLLHADDVLCLPALVELGWVEHALALAAVRISVSGRVIAENMADGA